MERYRRMTAQEQLRQAIDQQQSRLRRGAFPPDRQAAILALLRARDRLPRSSESEPPPDIVTGRRLANLGGNKAFQLCLEAAGDDATQRSAPSEGWTAGRALSSGVRLAGRG